MNLLIFNITVDADDPVLGFTTDWTNEIARRFEHVFVITMRAGRIDVAPNVEVLSIGGEKGYSRPRRVLEFYRRLTTLLRSRKIDACFAHMTPLMSIMGAPLLRLFRVPPFLWYAHGHVSLTLRIAERAVDRIITSSPHGCRLGSSKILVTGQGIDTHRHAFRAHRLHRDRLRLLYAGRLSPVKGLHILIDALALFSRRSKTPFRMTLVGAPQTAADRHYTARLKQRVLESGLAGCVDFAGAQNRDRMSVWYRECDVFINPSDTGSMDKTVLEAMATGSLAVTGNSSFDTDEYRSAGGFFARNDAGSICSMLCHILSLTDEDLAARAARGREWVECCHSLAALAQKIHLQAADLLAQKGALPGP